MFGNSVNDVTTGQMKIMEISVVICILEYLKNSECKYKITFVMSQPAWVFNNNNFK